MLLRLLKNSLSMYIDLLQTSDFERSWNHCVVENSFVICYESWVVPAGAPSALADIGGGVAANN